MIVWLIRAFSLLALLGFSAAVWLAGPMVGFGDARPLSSAGVRVAIIATTVALVACSYGFGAWRTRQAQRRLEAAVAGDGDSDADILESRLSQAIATLKRASGKRTFLYDLPWYVVIGPPGAGKTTALVNSGLKFPLAGAGDAQPVAGTGGTRYCDWWFTEEAVLIDTAGRYTTQDSDAAADSRSWLAFLSILKRHRPRQPINGVILAVSLSDLMTLNGQQLGGYVIEMRKRLDEISSTLKIDFPVYVLFTKADLVAGFMEYFGSFDEARRRKVWGATFQTADRHARVEGKTPALFDDLARRLSAEVADRIQEEPDPSARIAIFGFPARFGLLKQRVADFLAGVFDPAERHSAGNLRGFYFSSGTQEGTPIDQVLGAIGRGLGVGGREHLSGKGKSFFIHDLLAKVVFAESGWVSYDAAGDRRAVIGRYGAIAATALVTCVALGALGASFFANGALLSATETAAAQYRETAAPVLEQETVSEPDLENVAGALETLRTLPAGREYRSATTSPVETFGLGQRDRLASASETAYRQGLERLLRPRLLLQAEAALHRDLTDPIALYEPLKIYLMLGNKAPKADDELVVRWLNSDWERFRFPGSSNREGRAVLERHVRAMLEYDDAHGQAYELDSALVDAARRSLGRMTVADRAQAIFRSAMNTAPVDDFVVAQRAGPEAPLVFQARDATDLSDLRVPGIYTRAGFNDFYLDQLARVAQRLEDEQWVIGAGGAQDDLDEELLRLGPELLDRYGEEFAAAWNAVLTNLKFKPMSADKPQYLALSAAASANSPMRRLFEAVALETALTREPETIDPNQGSGATVTDALSPEDRALGLERIGIEVAGRKSQARAGAAFANAEGEVPGASIEAQFRPFYTFVEGRPGQRPIDALVQNFHDVYRSMVLAASAPTQAELANASLQVKIQAMRLNVSRLPKVLATMVQEAADELEGDAADTSRDRLNEVLQAAVTGPCREIVTNRYPFTGGGPGEVALSDFTRLFAPTGIIDRYFAQNLAPLVDMSGQSWEWRPETSIGRPLSKATLTQFQLAAEIRDAFFELGDSVPSVKLTFTPFSLHGDADMALLNVDGQIVQSYQTGSGAGTIEWPGTGSGLASISLAPELPGRQSSMSFEGDWALKRLLDSATVTRNGEAMEARFVIGGRDVAYTVQVGGRSNPFSLPALAQFSCPESL